jgi:uncharacterized membrane protein
MVVQLTRRFWNSLSGIGLLLGALLFAASLTPSLIPRGYGLQGLLGGVAFATGYGLAVAANALWDYLELPKLQGRAHRAALWLAIGLSAAIVLVFLSRAPDWQNDIRARMGMDLVSDAQPLTIGLIAVVVALALLLLARFIAILVAIGARGLGRMMPRRYIRAIGGTVALLLILAFANGVILRQAIRAADASFGALDALIEPDTPQPTDPMRTGSAASLIPWEDLGRRGREFVAGVTPVEAIAAEVGGAVMEPIRVFAGLTSAPTPEARAQIALQELIRVGGFERSVLIVATPTGTGWMDPAAMVPLEILHRGDVATVAVQYSYLSSWISLLLEPGYGVAGASATFDAVYGYWRTLPRESRPRLYLYGLSLGADSSDQSFSLLDVLGDPFDGALWVGPPYSTPMWKQVTAARNPGSLEVAPVIGDSSVVRFATQYVSPVIPGAEWDAMRIVYLQHASDPIVRFEMDSWRWPPEWMAEPRAPDVSPEMRWYPLVTFFQLIFDNMIALKVPMGFGHLYAPEDHVEAWAEVTEPPGWTDAELQALKARLAVRED